MKKQHIFLVMSVLMGVFTSCSQDNEIEDVKADREANFHIGISQTRTVTADKVTTFITDDKIGIFGLKRGGAKLFNNNVPYTYTSDQKWTAKPAITFPITGDEVNFYAYYPYGSYEGTTFDFTVLADQSVENGYAVSDLLMASNTVAQVNDKSIELQFKHVFAMIEVRPVFQEGSNVELQKVKLMAVRTATVDVVQQTAVVKTGVQPEEITLTQIGDGVYRAVVPVQTLKGRIFEFVGVDKATNLSAVYDYTLAADKDLAGNRITTFTINL